MPLTGDVSVLEQTEDHLLVRVRLNGPPGRAREFTAVSKVIGDISRLVCQVPKTVLRWREGTEGAFEARTLFLTTHCNPSSLPRQVRPTGRQVYGESLAYRWLEALGLPALQTRLALLRYGVTESSGQATAGAVELSPALFVEAAQDAARRIGGHLLNHDAEASDLPISSYTELDAISTASLALFQLMVANGDWFVAGLAPLRMYLRDKRDWAGSHNMFVVGFEEGRPKLLPLDFDLSALAGVTLVMAGLADIHPSTMLKRVAHPAWSEQRERDGALLEMGLYLWSRQFDAATRRAVIDRWLARRKALYAALASPALVQEVRTRGRELLDLFYARLTEPRGRVVTRRPKSPLYAGANDEAPSCLLPRGTPVVMRDAAGEEGRRASVRVVQALRLDGEAPRQICSGGVDALDGFIEPKDLLREGERPWTWTLHSR